MKPWWETKLHVFDMFYWKMTSSHARALVFKAGQWNRPEDGNGGRKNTISR